MALRDESTGKFVSTKIADTTKTPGENPDDKGGGKQPEGADADKGKAKENVDTSALERFGNRYLKGDTSDPADKKKKTPEEEEAERAVAEAAKKPKSKPVATAKPKSRTEEVLDRTTTVLERTASVLEKTLAKPEDKKPDTKQDDPDAKLPAEERRKVSVLRQMEADFPEKYKDLTQRYQTGQTKLQAYAADWQKNNPGKQFNPQDEEHEDFFAGNDVAWEDEDFVDSLTNLKVKKLKDEVKGEAKGKESAEIAELKRKDKLRDAAPNIAREEVTAARAAWKLMGDEFAELVKENGAVDVAKLTELQNADPNAMAIRIGAAAAVERLSGVMFKLLDKDKLEVFDPKNPTHDYLSRFALEQEQEILSAEPAEQLDAKRRQFKPRHEYDALSEADKKKYWTFGIEDFRLLIAAQEAARAKAAIELEEKKFRLAAKARGINIADKKPAGATAKQAERRVETDDDEEPEDTLNDDEKPRSPSSVSEPKVAAAAKKGGEAQTSGLNAFVKRAIAKS